MHLARVHVHVIVFVVDVVCLMLVLSALVVLLAVDTVFVASTLYKKKCRGCDKDRRHGEAQVVSLPVLEGGQNPDPRGTGEIGTQSNTW